jgi:hypothetical protein
LVRRTQDEARDLDWRPFSPDFSAVSVLAPMNILKFQKSRRGQALFTEPKGLQIRFLPQNLGQALTLANAVANRHVGSGRVYQSLKDERLIVSAETENGGGAYLRTQKIGATFAAVLVEWTKAESQRAALVIASIRPGPQDGLAVPRGGVLDQITAVVAPISPQANRADRNDDFWPNVVTTAKPDPRRPQLRRFTKPVGNAFYISNTDLLTSAYATAGCRQLQLADGTPARVVARDERKELAVITTDKRSSEWIDISVSFPDNGQDVIFVGYGDEDAAQGAQLGADQLPIKERARRDWLVGKVIMPRGSQWADHGSPVLDLDRKLAGIVVRHPKPNGRNEHTYFASAKFVRPFLEENNIIYRRAGKKPRKITKDALVASIRQVHCAAQ